MSDTQETPNIEDQTRAEAEAAELARAEAEAAELARAEAEAWAAEDQRRNELASKITVAELQQFGIRNGMSRDEILKACRLID